MRFYRLFAIFASELLFTHKTNNSASSSEEKSRTLTLYGTFFVSNGSQMDRKCLMCKSVSNKSAGHLVYTPYVIRNGVKIYPSKARFFRFWVAD
jgi:hypothetical protein